MSKLLSATHRSGTRAVVFAATVATFLLVGLSACQAKELTRTKAQKMLQEFANRGPRSIITGLSFRMNNKAFAAEKIFAFDAKKVKDDGLTFTVYEPFELTEAAKAYFSSATPPRRHTAGAVIPVGVATLAKPISPRIVEITGIADEGGGEIKEVRFRLVYELPHGLHDLLGDAFKNFEAPINTKCLFRLYDDGWRIEDCRLRKPLFD